MTFYFYDLETSGRDPRSQRIMQFAGQRTDENLHPIGEPFVRYIKLSDDILPEPEAVLLTGITPQLAAEVGVLEPEFLAEFEKEVLQPDTCIVGYNNIRFDDEFMRFTFWRNFYDAYEWQWRDGRCRWDLLDVVRMTRALRPKGINWPHDENNNPINKLTEITSSNGLDHENAHDALSDVQATIDVARLIKQHQPALFDYMFAHSNKKAVAELLDPERAQPILHTSGMLPPEFVNTSAMLPLFVDRAQPTKIICWDLRHDPAEFLELSVEQLQKRLFTKKEDLNGETRLPLKAIHTNKSPAVAPISILNKPGADPAIKLSVSEITEWRARFQKQTAFIAKLYDAWHEAPAPEYGEVDVDGALYGGGFLSDADKEQCFTIRRKSSDLAGFEPEFNDARLAELYFRYKARNYPKSLSEAEHVRWEELRKQKLIDSGSLSSFGAQLQALSSTTDPKAQGLLTDLQLYAESIIPDEYSL